MPKYFMRLNELFNTRGVEWVSANRAVFTVDDENFGIVFVRDAGGGNWYDFAFYRFEGDPRHDDADKNRTHVTTGLTGRAAIRVFGTVSNAVREFIERHKPVGMEFVGFQNDGHEGFYTNMIRFLSKEIEQLGYVVRVKKLGGYSEHKHGPGTRWQIWRKDKAPVTEAENPALKAWFRNSKVTNAEGQPLVVYHGTSADIHSFEHSHNGAGSRESKIGFWFTNNTEAADGFASWARKGNDRYDNVVPVYLSIQNPWYPENYSEIKDLIDRHTKFSRPGMIVGDRQIRMIQDKIDYDGARAELAKNGYDGIILLNTITDSPRDDVRINQYVVLRPNQIKSAMNKGSFDSENDHISEEKPSVVRG